MAACLLKGCQPKLRALTIDVWMRPDDFVDCLRQLPDLEDLTLGYYTGFKGLSANLLALVNHSSDLTAIKQEKPQAVTGSPECAEVAWSLGEKGPYFDNEEYKID